MVLYYKKTRSRKHPIETMRDVDYADDLVLFTNIQGEYLLPSLVPKDIYT